MFNIDEELAKLPHKPGCYIMHDESDNVIYVGKAVNLYNRVRSYFYVRLDCQRFHGNIDLYYQGDVIKSDESRRYREAYSDFA